MREIAASSLFAVVVWYNPASDYSLVIDDYAHHLGGVVVVDNSAEDNRSLIRSSQANIYYLPQYHNVGIARALNIGMQYALQRGATHVLTMDQDSRFREGDIERFITICNAYPNREETAVFAPVHSEVGDLSLPTYQEPIAVMTSGDIIDLDDLRLLGPMREDFFIDLVDNEFCARILLQEKRVVTVNAVTLLHQLGNGTKYNSFWHKHFQDHAPWRYYYMARNMLTIIREYPNVRSYHKKQWRKFTKRLFLYDTHHKWTKIYYLIRGWKDYVFRHYGKMP